MKKFLLLITALFLLSASNASALMFDVTGTGNAGTAIDVTKWDWAPSTAVAVGGNGVQIGSSFDLFTFGTLSAAFSGTTNVSSSLNLTGLGKEITFVTGFSETVIDLSGTTTQTASFMANPAGRVNFFEVYISDINSDADLVDGVAGSGFNDGTWLFRGKITSGIGSFTSFFPPTTPVVRLDAVNGGTDGVVDDATATNAFANGASNANPQMTVRGVGGSSIQTIVKFDQFNTDYFTDITSPLWYLFDTETQNNLPFNQVDPSNRYWDGSALKNVFIGRVNGAPGNGPDVIFQTDASTSDAGVVPEPATLLLLGFGLLGFAGVARRK